MNVLLLLWLLQLFFLERRIYREARASFCTTPHFYYQWRKIRQPSKNHYCNGLFWYQQLFFYGKYNIHNRRHFIIFTKHFMKKGKNVLSKYRPCFFWKNLSTFLELFLFWCEMSYRIVQFEKISFGRGGEDETWK